MLKVGVLGDYALTTKILSNIFERENKSLILMDIKDKNSSSNSDIIIINKPVSGVNLKNIPKNCIIIINSDTIEKLPQMNLNNISYLITTGFSNKATLTISSVSCGTFQSLQCCLQRTMASISGNTIYEQEFLVETNSDNIPVILCSVAAALLTDVNLSSIKSGLSNL